MLAINPGRLINKYVPDYVVFDLETTGLSYKKDEVIEISALKVIGGQIVDQFSTLVDPGRHIPYTASSVNGIVDEMVQGCPSFEEALGSFLEFAGDMMLVGHNVKCFDLCFLYRDAMKFWGKTIGNDYVDTVILARAYLPDMSHALGDLALYYDISTEGAHRALADCHMTYQVFEKLKCEMEHPSASLTVKWCPRCGNLLRKRSGKFGEFWGCGSFPECRYTEDVIINQK